MLIQYDNSIAIGCIWHKENVNEDRLYIYTHNGLSIRDIDYAWIKNYPYALFQGIIRDHD